MPSGGGSEEPKSCWMKHGSGFFFSPAVVKTRLSLRADYNLTELLNMSSCLSLSVKGFFFLVAFTTSDVICVASLYTPTSRLSIFQTELHQDQGGQGRDGAVDCIDLWKLTSVTPAILPCLHFHIVLFFLTPPPAVYSHICALSSSLLPFPE